MCELKPMFQGEAEYYRHLFETYNEVVIRCEAALDDTVLAQCADLLPRCEALVNQQCYRDCQFCDRHIASMEALNLAGRRPGAGDRPGSQSCYYLNEARQLPKRLANSLFISESRIRALACRGLTKFKPAGRNQPLPRLMDQLATYVFEPTGIVYDLKNELIREFKDAEARLGHPMAPYTLPRGGLRGALPSRNAPLRAGALGTNVASFQARHRRARAHV